jgi:hypothetical protein
VTQPLQLSIEGSAGAERLVIEDPQLVVAGFTGRDPAAVEAHIAELRELGVPAPADVPAFFHLPGDLLRIAPTIVHVRTSATSGEAEPVLIRLPSGDSYVGVGSDHTDRDLERESLEASKLACAKVLGERVWRLEDVAGHWDELVLAGHSGTSPNSYQRSTLAELREPADLLARLDGRRVDGRRPLIVYLGTVALADGFRFDSAFEATLLDPRSGRRLSCAYEVLSVCKPKS